MLSRGNGRCLADLDICNPEHERIRYDAIAVAYGQDKTKVTLLVSLANFYAIPCRRDKGWWGS